MEIIKDEVSKYAVLNKEKIFIVLSSSMPDHAIKEYFKRLDGIEGVDFVFRGILHNDLKSFRPMMEYIQFILKKDSNGGYEKSNLYNVNISINPKVTQKYNITKVPALIYIQNYDPTLEDSKALSQSDNTKEKVWVEYGLISPQYVLNKINKTAKSEWINSILYKDSYFKDGKNNKIDNKKPTRIQELERNGVQ
ncbi:type-F conjugative transfer system pilin assembly protein TrbC [Campylobacter hyointestinalis subsp. hyointestinalis]|uniref:Type-F conjugative transfer system pilin assembly protein TrbC n=1 Tax=Campylobacter hyointestinalis subsp. hyointestinalis TaxID=91352 RepID=A0A9W5ASU2_CAMHY|nr:TrbC family F-type conjugative pilus assembly protein [Campylobacter hyointestinalis]CUU70671.1 type-F conjugative transfer system pilin assembly protein TrbC [Campylobacter hyointestinalis subsp. hyointestinalis]CUU70675.1 type-F conjugative transfer system pilin assembly protein TrbC [Campylobacter hyointestinalis subsp. hyointestinalis]CUU85637.1 type-F conjugative transfer system pilin assembly protein TrbC [Campylobacter hyointestinalis subsp. hyointestinalis]